MTFRISAPEDLVQIALLRATLAAEVDVGQPIRVRLVPVEELLRNGDAEPAIVMLCRIIHEYGVRIEQSEYDSIARIAANHGVDPFHWHMIAGLVSGEPPPGYVDPVTVWAVECQRYSDKSVLQFGVFSSEDEARRLLEVKSEIDWGEVYLNILAVHRRVVDWEWDA